jgi:uncharacterized protein (DUF433 family)
MSDVNNEVRIIDPLGSRGQLMARRSARDVREAPVYTALEASRYLHLPPSTVRAWAFGQRYGKGSAAGAFQPVIKPADRETRRLSFLNLIELLVLAAIRRKHAVSLPQVRRALRFLERRFPSPHPLADHQFQTNGAELFVEKFGEILNVSRDGQVEMRELLHAYLRCVERDDRGVPVKLYLPSLKPSSVERGVIVIDPRISFGRPVLDGTGIRAEIIVDRFRAGEPIDSLAQDYGRSREEIEAVVRSELAAAA